MIVLKVLKFDRISICSRTPKQNLSTTLNIKNNNKSSGTGHIFI